MPPMALLLPVAWWLLMLLQPATTQGSTSAQARSVKVDVPPYTRGKGLYRFVLSERDRANGVNVPSYTRGKGLYRFVLSERDRANGVSYYGSAERLRIAIDKMKKGEPVRISTVGGSITAGQGASDGLSWPQYVFNWASDHYGENDADIIFVEYSVNDVTPKEPPFINNIRRAFERLLRKLLQYPNRPAVVLMHSYIWGQPVPFVGSYWSNAEHELSKFGLYYGLPSLSVKAAVYHHMVAGEAGFQVNNSRNSDPDGLGGVSFYYDRVHPDGTTGARMTAELAMQLIRSADRDIGLQAVSLAEAKSVGQSFAVFVGLSAAVAGGLGRALAESEAVDHSSSVGQENDAEPRREPQKAAEKPREHAEKPHKHAENTQRTRRAAAERLAEENTREQQRNTQKTNAEKHAEKHAETAEHTQRTLREHS
eukprot:gene32023-16547_t